MSLSSPSPICTANATSTLNGVNVTAASTVTIALVDTAGVKQWSLSCINTDDLLSAATVTAGLAIDSVAKTATFTAPAAGSALIFKSVVNNGKDANGAVDPTLTTTFGAYVLTTSGYRTAAFDEKTEGSAAFGWITKINAVVRNNLVSGASAGNGILFSAGAYSVKPDANGSIVVAAGGVKVGTLPALTCSGNATVGGTLAVTGAATCAALSCTTLAASSNATVGGTLAVTGSTTCAALACTTLTRTGAETLSGVGAYRNVRVTAGSTTTTVYDGRQFDILVVPALPGNRTYLLGALGVNDRVRITIERMTSPSVNTLVVADNTSSATLATYAASLAGSADFYWNGTTWLCLSRTTNVT